MKNEIISSIKKYVNENGLDGVIRLLTMRHESENNEDIDIFFEVSNETDRFQLIQETSKISAYLSIRHNILVSIYPVLEKSIINPESQFSINVKTKTIEF